MKERIVLIGAGSVMFTRGVVADLARAGIELELTLVDIDHDALAVAEGLSRKIIETREANITVKATTDRREALHGATSVITTIGVGGRRAWEQDVFIPRKYGVFQPVGDSIMPGGTSRALRMIPQTVDIANDVLDLAPNALFINYSNPMSAICRGVRKATGANMVGLCIGVWHVANYLAESLGITPGRLTYSAVGMNHLTWFTDIHVDGVDALPRLREIAARKKMLAASLDGNAARTIEHENIFSWQLLDLYGTFPAVLDRHIVEFFPQFFADGSYFGGTLGVDRISFEDVIAEGDQAFEEMREDAFSSTPLQEDYFDKISGEHEQAVEIIQSIRSNAGRVYSVNLPNTGQIPNLPMDAVVECPAIADSRGLTPIPQRGLPTAVAGTLIDKFAWAELVVEAALEGSRDKFVQALIVDGSVRCIEDANLLADELLAAQAQYLPLFQRELITT